jgi:hypothetical protein
MSSYKIQDRIIYNPTNSSDKRNFLYGNIIDIDGIYLYIRFDNNEKIFKLLSTDICLDQSNIIEEKNKKIIITI